MRRCSTAPDLVYWVLRVQQEQGTEGGGFSYPEACPLVQALKSRNARAQAPAQNARAHASTRHKNGGKVQAATRLAPCSVQPPRDPGSRTGWAGAAPLPAAAKAAAAALTPPPMSLVLLPGLPLTPSCGVAALCLSHDARASCNTVASAGLSPWASLARHVAGVGTPQ